LQIAFEVADALLRQFNGIFEPIDNGMGFRLPDLKKSLKNTHDRFSSMTGCLIDG
jgi:hypothetical protein